MHKNLKIFLACILIPIFLGTIAGLLNNNSMISFQNLDKPTLSPPAWLFPIVWTILYLLMGISSYYIVTSDASKEEIRTALLPYGLQLVFNFFWSFLFFTYEKYCLAFVWLLILLALIFLTTKRFLALSKKAALLLLPYIVWVIFAGYLNLSICLLN